MANNGGAQNGQFKRPVPVKLSVTDNVDLKTVVVNNHQKEKENQMKAVSRQRHIKRASFNDTVSTSQHLYV